MLAEQLNKYWELYQSGRLSKGDVVGLFLILYDQLFPVENWLQYSPSRKLISGSIQSHFFPKQSSDFERHPFFKKIQNTQSLGDVFNQSLLKKETLRSCLGLMHVYTEPDTIKILDFIPTPMQVLEMQTQGFRCVTLLRTTNWFLFEFDHKRNIRDFVIHDLEHIWQMFENPTLKTAQIQFSKKLFELTSQGRFEFLLSDPKFRSEFDYIISDMNTHPAHTYATLKSLLCRQKNKEMVEISDIMQHFDSLVIG